MTLSGKKQLEKGNKALEQLGLKDADLDEYERMPLSGHMLA